MSGYLDLTTLGTAIRSGPGTAIICEGERRDEDEGVYRRWFASLATAVTFYAQDGLAKVGKAVEHLRATELPVRVYGLIDRDFRGEDRVASQHAACPPDHVFCTDRFTLENYVLQAEGWFLVVKALYSRQPGLPDGWDAPEAILDRLTGFFDSALPVAAHNYAVCQLDTSHYGAPGFQDRKHLPSVKALAGRDLASELARWGAGFGAGVEAVRLYEERLTLLRTLTPPDRLHPYVHGRLVLDQLQAALPLPPQWPGLTSDRLVDLYLDKAPDPPADLARLIQRILDCAAAERR